jgi:hypothetical protein
MPLLLAFTLLIGCNPSGVQAQDVTVHGEPLTDVLQRLEAQSAPAEPATGTAEETQAPERAAKLKKLDERITLIELAVADMQQHGIENAKLVRFDPRETTLASENLQDATTELEQRVSKVEHKLLDDLGEASGALFDMDQQRHEMGRPSKGGRGGKGGPDQQGPPGPPPGGGGGQGGGGQGGGGQGGGGQGGGGQGGGGGHGGGGR